ncbi:MAG: threonine-phosphate decarboxylase CobD, partial [Gammaproteobacteria bacterium]
MLEHGGRILHAARRYGIPVADWLDLSTGINPNGWPVPPIPPECWQRLPEDDDGLLETAQRYYRSPTVLPVAGSQAAIQTLPLLRERSRCGLLRPAYAEHEYHWRQAGHDVVVLDADAVEQTVDELEVLLLINPNNPTGRRFEPDRLLHWHRKLQRRGGWLVVDEAFTDAEPELSLAPYLPRPGLIVLRSLGKFFGLAGARCGFALAEKPLLAALGEKLGPWTVSGPSRYIATQALNDSAWQNETRTTLIAQAERLQRLLERRGLHANGRTALFAWTKTP